MSEKVRLALEFIIKKFESGDIAQSIAYATFPIPNIPAAQWSLLNRTLMLIAGTQDARGFRQWQEVGRYVKKGSKAITILAPRFIKKQNGEEEKRKSWPDSAVPFFRLEDTEGQPLD